MEKIRRYDLDWLRVLVFALLIFYHVGMYFVPWQWHIKYENPVDWLTYPMYFINQWRLPILFVISGMGTAFALGYRTSGQFIRERFYRLLIPLLFGMLVIVPPQVFFERKVSGAYEGSYIDFLLGPAFTNSVYPEGNISWHHLWFLPYLLVFSVILVPVFIRMRNHNRWKTVLEHKLSESPLHLLWFLLPLYLYEILLEPIFGITHNLVWDWFNFVNCLTLFFFGFVLIQIREVFWVTAQKIRKQMLVAAIISFLVLLTIRILGKDSLLIHLTEGFFKVFNMWAWIIVIFGYASQYLNRNVSWLSYANQAVYPFYILHQTVTVILGYYLLKVHLPFMIEFLILILGTFVISWFVFEFVIRRVSWLWPLFGVKRPVIYKSGREKLRQTSLQKA
ncbi:acyltransferase family protein [Robertkochia aurantiaca]|uniref:acyltransferase family protein n=1 Tax=Robertkochia aurantiaca TaxID=2873700 RepID=UPI001CCBD173|nr:acyltransferase family protein [Robertkochia sp. 3YJGBD-33]